MNVSDEPLQNVHIENSDDNGNLVLHNRDIFRISPYQTCFESEHPEKSHLEWVAENIWLSN